MVARVMVSQRLAKLCEGLRLHPCLRFCNMARARRTEVKNLQKTKMALSEEEQKSVKGGLLPYVEQDNVKSTDMIDGTSNTIKEK